MIQAVAYGVDGECAGILILGTNPSFTDAGQFLHINVYLMFQTAHQLLGGKPALREIDPDALDPAPEAVRRSVNGPLLAPFPGRGSFF